jgi:hypothetical protein|tara:strand:- start:401 stop:535 length:135 start_codon:yes stop_codon:yes gene_type:complete
MLQAEKYQHIFGAYTPLMANRFLSLGEKESVQMQKVVHIARTGK